MHSRLTAIHRTIGSQFFTLASVQADSTSTVGRCSTMNTIQVVYVRHVSTVGFVLAMQCRSWASVYRVSLAKANGYGC